jgi:TRAP-type C4-dicarboxylate transport system permease small subunit
MGLVWMSFLAGSYAISRKANIRIELLMRMLPERARTWLEFATNLLLLGLFGTLFVIGTRYTLAIAPSSTGAMVVSQAYFYAAVPVSAVFMGCYSLLALWEERPWRRLPAHLPRGASR